MAAKHKLTDRFIKNIALEPGQQKKFADGAGLYLSVQRSGSKLWHYRYQFDGKEQTYSLGEYPNVSLREAREQHEKLRARVKEGFNPAVERRYRANPSLEGAVTFKKVASEYDQKILPTTNTEASRKRTYNMVKNHANPIIGDMLLDDIKPRHILTICDKQIQEGKIPNAHRLATTISAIFRWAMRQELCETDPAYKITEALPAKPETHYNALLEPKRVGQFLGKASRYRGSELTRLACQLLPHLMLRPGNLLHMEWEWVNWEKRWIEFPAGALKKRRAHIVPMSSQVFELMQAAEQLSLMRRYVFPNQQGNEGHMGDSTLKQAYLRMGFTPEEVHPHGWRATARTLMAEVLKHRTDLLEIQLAHITRAPNGRAYDRTEFIEDRIQMMQEWSDYLAKLQKEHGKLKA